MRSLALALGCTAGAFLLGWFAHGFLRNVDVPATLDRAEKADVPAPAAEPETSERWRDRTHEIQVVSSFYMSGNDLYHLGTWQDRTSSDPEFKVMVQSTVGQGVPSVVEVVHSTGFEYWAVTLRFDAKTKRVEAEIESEGDAYPQPPPKWTDVSGIVYVSDMEWGLGRAVIVDYSLYGVRGGRRRCVHERVSVDL